MNLRVDQNRTVASPAPADIGPAAPDSPPGSDGAAEKRTASLRPLVSLLPYFKRYRWRALGAFIALVVAATTTLVVPIAVRRMIDFGFSARGT